ncbi:unnamed protein product [Phytophthora fragariaefolia]|uniref:Unnamed protein product n=1 Tax=Phytophthora fragariaefolia TaxID=1490495 RepID=A0A9W6XN98_9STRA|nr:unnamed protein product [Phytophthora fragariaefolia]
MEGVDEGARAWHSRSMLQHHFGICSPFQQLREHDTSREGSNPAVCARLQLLQGDLEANPAPPQGAPAVAQCAGADLGEQRSLSIDLTYHGSNRDDSISAVVNEAAATVDHLASRFVRLSTNTVRREVHRLRAEFGERPIVGIGHSVGAGMSKPRAREFLLAWCCVNRQWRNPGLMG